MKKALPIAAIAFMAFLCGTASATIVTDAAAYNITIYDGQSTANPWYGPQEDNEVEPGMMTGQGWDFEAYFWNDTTRTLYLVGGFDFINGLTSGNVHYTAGDVFLYEGTTGYFLDLDRVGGVQTNLDATYGGTGGYDIWKEGNTWTYYNVTVAQNQGLDPNGSDPYANDTRGDTLVQSGLTYDAYTITAAQATALGLLGAGQRYVMEFAGLPKLDFGSAEYFYVTWTMLCGNDEGDGKIPVPEPAAIGMAVAGLCGLVMGRRKLRRHL